MDDKWKGQETARVNKMVARYWVRRTGKHADESKKKISEALKKYYAVHKGPRFGAKNAAEHNDKIRCSLKGKKRGALSECWRGKISVALKGRKKPEGFSENLRMKNLGKKHSKEAIEKMKARVGRKHSEESKKKMSESHKSHPSSHKVSESTKEVLRRKRLLQKFPLTRIERKVRAQLRSKGLSIHEDFEMQVPFANKYILDFLLVKKGIVIECDGWHHKQFVKMRNRDFEKDVCVREKGLTMVRIEEEEIMSESFDIERVLNGKGLSIW